MRYWITRKLYQHRAPGYNIPIHFAMWVSQWAHVGFISNRYSYKTYTCIQSLAYWLFTFRIK